MIKFKKHNEGISYLHNFFYRENLLHQKPVDITPKNEGKFPWSKTEDIDKFESEWSLKPVIVKGIFDHSNEIQV